MVDKTRKIVEQFVFSLFNGDTMQPILYYLPPSPPCRAVLMLARMLELEFDLKSVNPLEGEQFQPEFIELNPQHTIPTIDDHGLILWESRAIMTYLVAAYGKSDILYPRDIRIRAVIDQRLQFDLGTLFARMADYFFPSVFTGAPLDETKKARLDEALGWLEDMLKNRVWVADTNFTVADMTLTVTVSQIEAFGFDLAPYPGVSGWFEKCKLALEPYGYDEINKTGAEFLGGLLRAKLK